MEVYKYLKRFIDIALAFLLLVLLFPLLILISVIVKLTSKGPVIFVHKRIGKNGKVFGLYKFRTMVPNAEELIENFSSEQMIEYKNTFKLKNDPRVTKFGQFLRKSSLDELPQLFNVLKGELSLIGPRPIIKEELEKYKDNKEKLLSIRPGLTGYWVAYSNKETTYEERINMELNYVDNVSFKLDIKIFFKTINAIINRFFMAGGVNE